MNSQRLPKSRNAEGAAAYALTEAAHSGAPERFTPLFNDAFLQIFGSADSEPVTKPMLNAILRAVDIPEIEGVERIVADTSLPGGVECKTPRIDVVVMCDDGRLFDLEAERRQVDIEAKSLFYAAKLLVENTPKGLDDSYSAIPQVAVVVLLDGSTLFPDSDKMINVCRMRWDAQLAPDRPQSPGGTMGSAAGPDNITIVVAELKKVREKYNSSNVDDALADEATAWLYLLAAGYEHPEEVKRIMEHFPTMEEFAKRYGIALGDPDLKRAYDRYWGAQMEYNSIMEEARKVGRAEGRAAGYAEGRAEGYAEGVDAAAMRLRAAGFDEDAIRIALGQQD